VVRQGLAPPATAFSDRAQPAPDVYACHGHSRLASGSGRPHYTTLIRHVTMSTDVLV
jgi:hypothetical protein